LLKLLTGITLFILIWMGLGTICSGSIQGCPWAFDLGALRGCHTLNVSLFVCLSSNDNLSVMKARHISKSDMLTSGPMAATCRVPLASNVYDG
jgi:hypothetical protein